MLKLCDNSALICAKLNIWRDINLNISLKFLRVLIILLVKMRLNQVIFS